MSDGLELRMYSLSKATTVTELAQADSGLSRALELWNEDFVTALCELLEIGEKAKSEPIVMFPAYRDTIH